MTHEVVFAPEAETDLLELYDGLLGRAGSGTAFDYTSRVQAYCLGLATFPERGVRRDDLRTGLRITAFRRRVTIAYHISDDRVIIDRLLYGGRDIVSLFEDGNG